MKTEWLFANMSLAFHRYGIGSPPKEHWPFGDMSIRYCCKIELLTMSGLIQFDFVYLEFVECVKTKSAFCKLFFDWLLPSCGSLFMFAPYAGVLGLGVSSIICLLLLLRFSI